MASIRLIRHGEPEVTGVLLGQLDPPLSAAGRKKARAALGHIRPTLIWTSTLRRARETADLMGTAPIREMPDLREMHMGAWTGLRWEQVEAGWSDLSRAKLRNWMGFSAPGGESWTGFLQRVERAWETIRNGPEDAAVVAHQAVLGAIRYLIDGSDPGEFQMRYGEVMWIAYNPND